MSLADQIIEHQPWSPDALAGFQATGEEMNALRDELNEGRRLRAAAEARERINVYAPPYRSGGKVVLGIHHDGCPNRWWDEAADFTALADLVRRADEHTEECR